jgi:hypothetical protein
LPAVQRQIGDSGAASHRAKVPCDAVDSVSVGCDLDQHRQLDNTEALHAATLARTAPSTQENNWRTPRRRNRLPIINPPVTTL